MKMNKNRRMRFLIVLSGASVLLSGTCFLCGWLDTQRSARAYRELRDCYVRSEIRAEDTSGQPCGGTADEAFSGDDEASGRAGQSMNSTGNREAGTGVQLSVDWIGLSAVNPDIVGWIYVRALPDISYPIVQGFDDALYVDRSFEGRSSKGGCIFLSCLNASDLSSPNSLIYGHNMRDGSMFSLIYDHRADGTFDREPYIDILTPEGTVRYRIFSVFETERSSDVFRIYPLQDGDYSRYLADMAGRNTMFRGTAEVPGPDSRVITLVTCVPDTYNRIVVFAAECP